MKFTIDFGYYFLGANIFAATIVKQYGVEKCHIEKDSARSVVEFQCDDLDNITFIFSFLDSNYRFSIKSVDVVKDA